MATGIVGLMFATRIEAPCLRNYYGSWLVVVPDEGRSRVVAEVESEAMGTMLLEAMATASLVDR